MKETTTFRSHFLNSNKIMITSDLGPVRLCSSCETGNGPTEDFDVVVLENGTRTVINADDHQQTIFIPDEVAWFCGSKPNLSSCTFHPRIMDIEALYLEHSTWDSVPLIPPDLLKNYGPMYCCYATMMYSMAYYHMNEKLSILNPDELAAIDNEIQQMYTYPFPGFTDTTAMANWLDSTKFIRRKKHVIPAVMHEFGLGINGCPINRSISDRVVPAWCEPLHGALENLILTNYIVETDGKVSLQAGNRIRLLPNTKVMLGGYLYAKIDNNLPYDYCSLPWAYTPLTVENNSDKLPKVVQDHQLIFKIYPNPATNSFWVELPNDYNASEINIELMDFLGAIVLKQSLAITNKILVRMGNPSKGIYIVKASKGKLTGYQKLVID